jgi:hypothetical protein
MPGKNQNEKETKFVSNFIALHKEINQFEECDLEELKDFAEKSYDINVNELHPSIFGNNNIITSNLQPVRNLVTGKVVESDEEEEDEKPPELILMI